MIALLLLACDLPPVEEPTYRDHVKPILAEHCVRCHTSGGRRDGGVELDVYASARSVRIGIACTALAPAVMAEFPGVFRSASAEPEEPDCHPYALGSMPPDAIGGLPQGDQWLLADWVAEGAVP